MDKTNYIFLDLPTVRRLIAGKRKRDKYRNYELIVAIFLSKFCEEMWGAECAIGFPLKDTEARTVPLVGSSNLSELQDILNLKTEQAHDVDALIVKHTPENSQRIGQGFQIKRFHTFQPDLTTEGLIQFIQGLKYAKTETALVVLLETGEPTAFTRVRDAIDFSTFPFSALYFVGLYGKTLRFIEVWPGLGKAELNWDSI